MLPYNPKVVVLLSTFNGESFLKEQLNSLLNQTYPNVDILIRDDGSTDQTLNILKDYEQLHNITVTYGNNIGVVGSFFKLIELVPEKTSYVSFCDQDDLWDVDKIERAVKSLSYYKQQEPMMYCGALRCVDKNLKLIRTIKGKCKPSFENALVQNIATGCTILLNNAALRLIANKPIDLSNILMHDWWIYQVITALGTVIFDPNPTISYRQHGNNTVGFAFGLNLWKRRIIRHINRNSNMLRRQIKELLNTYEPELPAEKYMLASELLTRTSRINSFVQRATFACRTRVYRQKLIDDIIMRILIIIGRF